MTRSSVRLCVSALLLVLCLCAQTLDRAEALGGQILLDSPPDAGTTLRLELPLSEAEHAARGLR